MTPEQLAAWRSHVTNIVAPERVSIPKADLAAIIAEHDRAVAGEAAARAEAAEWRRIASSTFGESAMDAVAEVNGYTL